MPDVWPKYAEAVEGGFAASVKKGGRLLECPGPYANPEEAHEAMLELLAAEFPAPGRQQLVTLPDCLAA